MELWSQTYVDPGMFAKLMGSPPPPSRAALQPRKNERIVLGCGAAVMRPGKRAQERLDARNEAMQRLEARNEAPEACNGALARLEARNGALKLLEARNGTLERLDARNETL